VKIFCVKTENFLDFFVFCSISSKLLLAGFCRFLPGTRGNAAKIHSYNIPKRFHKLGNESLPFPPCILHFFAIISAYLFHSL
jgi:hypothetical protein